MIKLKDILNENNNLKIRTQATKLIQDMVKYSDRIGSDDMIDLKKLLKLIQKIK